MNRGVGEEEETKTTEADTAADDRVVQFVFDRKARIPSDRLLFRPLLRRTTKRPEREIHIVASQS